MKEKLNKFVLRILSSFDNNTEGMSAKKLSAFAAMVAYVKAHEFVTSENVVLVLGVDTAFITALLGMNAYERLQDKKNKGPEPTNETPS